MKIRYKILFGLFIVSSMFFVNSCDPFEDFYLTLSMDKQFNVQGYALNQIYNDQEFCLTDFEDYNDNRDKLEEMRYITCAYSTFLPSNGLKADSLVLTLDQDNGTNLFKFTLHNFIADDYLGNPLEINLSEKEINNINQYLSNPKDNKCFKAKLSIFNVSDNDGLFFQLYGKVEFLTDLKVKP